MRPAAARGRWGPAPDAPSIHKSGLAPAPPLRLRPVLLPGWAGTTPDLCRKVVGPWRPLGKGKGVPHTPTERRRTHSSSGTSLHLGSCEGLRGGAGPGGASALGVLQELPGGKSAGDSASQHPGYPPGLLAPPRSFGTPTPGLGVSHAPHLLAPGPRRPRPLIPRPCTGDFASCPKGRVPRGAVTRAVAGAGSAGLRAAGRGGQGGRGGRGGEPPSRAPLRVSQPGDPEGGGRCALRLAPHFALPSLHSGVHPFIHTFRNRSTFLPPAAPHSERTYCVPAGPAWAAAESHGAEGIPAPPLPAASPSEDEGGTGGHRGETAPAPPPAKPWLRLPS